MSRRDHAHDRCPRCRLHLPLCLCAQIPVIQTRTRLLLLLHAEEAQKPTNTGRLAALCLPNSSMVLVGERDRPLSEPPVPGGERAVLLFPSEDAVPLADVAGDGPLTLVVPDGTWRQARKMRTRVPGLATLPCVTLPAGEATSYRLRSERREGGLATLEAIARALQILEGPEASEALLRIFKVMVERTLWMRGSIPDGKLTGGVPLGARRG